MPNLPTDKFELLDFRDILIEQRDAAQAAGDTAKVEDLTKKINIAQEAIDRIALEGLQRLSAILNDLRLKLESLQQSVEDWPFGTAEAPADHERPFREDNLQDNDFEDQGPSSDAPEPAPVPPGTVPVVSPGWSENYFRQLGSDRQAYLRENNRQPAPLRKGGRRHQRSLVVCLRCACHGVQPSLRPALAQW